MITFYLSGGMEFKTNLGSKWRSWLTEELAKFGYSVIDPVQLEVGDHGEPLQRNLTAWKESGQLDKVRQGVRDVLFVRDIRGLHQSDAMILFYDESVQRGAGTLSEAWEAFREGKPIYVVTEFPTMRVPTWLIGETTGIFTSFEFLLEYVQHTQLIRDDISAAEVARDKMLASI
jgi:hypothetical protein